MTSARPALIAIALAMLASSPAHAERTTVFPLAAKDLAEGVPAALTAAVVKASGGELAKYPIEDAGDLLGCSVEASSCLERIAKSVDARRLVFGSAIQEGATIKVTLNRFDVGPAREERTFTLTGTTPDALADELVAAARPLLGGSVAKPPRVVAPPDRPPVDLPPPPDAPRGGIAPATWLVVGAGVVAIGVGAVFVAKARGLQRDVDAAPTETFDDLERLSALERRGKRATVVGYGLIGAGAVAAIAAVVVGVARRPAASRVDVEPVVSGSGVTLVVRWMR